MEYGIKHPFFMKKIVIFIASCLLLAGFFMACKPSAEEKEKQRVRRSLTPNPISWDTLYINKAQPLESEKVQASANLMINYIYPISYENQEVLEKVAREIAFYVMGEEDTYITMPANEALESYATSYFANYEKETKSKLELWNKVNGRDIFSYNYNIETKVVYNEANLISYQIATSEGAGKDSIKIVNTKNIVLDLANGALLSENDLFVEDYSERLNQLLIQQLLKDTKADSIEVLHEKGYWGITDIAANNNFFVTWDGITYTFNPDEYADAKLGTLKIFIDFDDLLPIIKEGAPITILTKEE